MLALSKTLTSFVVKEEYWGKKNLTHLVRC